MKLLGFVALVLWPLLSLGQEVQVTAGKGSVLLSVSAQQPYELLAGEKKLPELSVDCVRRGKKTGHFLIFSPGGTLVADDPEAAGKDTRVTLAMTTASGKVPTLWVFFGDTQTYAYFSDTEPHRLQFIHSVLNSKRVAIDFKPFLTGTPITSVFDVSRLQAEMDRHAECTEQ